MQQRSSYSEHTEIDLRRTAGEALLQSQEVPLRAFFEAVQESRNRIELHGVGMRNVDKNREGLRD